MWDHDEMAPPKRPPGPSLLHHRRRGPSEPCPPCTGTVSSMAWPCHATQLCILRQCVAGKGHKAIVSSTALPMLRKVVGSIRHAEQAPLIQHHASTRAQLQLMYGMHAALRIHTPARERTSPKARDRIHRLSFFKGPLENAQLMWTGCVNSSLPLNSASACAASSRVPYSTSA